MSCSASSKGKRAATWRWLCITIFRLLNSLYSWFVGNSTWHRRRCWMTGVYPVIWPLLRTTACLCTGTGGWSRGWPEWNIFKPCEREEENEFHRKFFPTLLTNIHYMQSNLCFYFVVELRSPNFHHLSCLLYVEHMLNYTVCGMKKMKWIISWSNDEHICASV